MWPLISLDNVSDAVCELDVALYQLRPNEPLDKKTSGMIETEIDRWVDQPAKVTNDLSGEG